MDNSTQQPKQALLVMDMITTIVHRLADNPILPSLIAANQTAIAAARKTGIPVIYVGLDFRKDGSDLNPANRMFGAFLQHPQALEPFQTPWQVDPSLEVLPEDIRVTKKRVSAFAGSDLELVLRSGGIDHLVLTGIATSGIVLSTLREAADKDYRLSVLSDACADRDEEVHRLLLTKVFPGQAEVLTATEWADGLVKA